MKRLDFDTILPRLAATYEAGRLVPFIGAGLSVPTCRGWEALVEGLERQAGIEPPAAKAASESKPATGSKLATESKPEKLPPEELVRRANTAVRRLRAREPEALARHVREALYAGDAAPAQCGALARIWWPLVVTTNYDDCFAHEFESRLAPRRLDVVGRSAADCQRVLSSLEEPSRALLWAVQGFAGGPCDPIERWQGSERVAELEAQMVVGHEEYRRVTYRELSFRRAFAEVYRSRSLFFLGSGIRESYLQELFGEILETYGPCSRPHYALMIREEADPGFVRFMQSRFQTLVVSYDTHDELPRMLGRLASWIDASSQRALRWSFGSPRSRRRDDLEHVNELEVVRGPLPLTPAEGECLAVSAGGHGEGWYFSDAIRDVVLPAWGVDARSERPSPLTKYVGRYAEKPVLAVRARSEKDERGLQHIYRASRDLFREAAKQGFRRVRMQLLAAGGSEPIRRDVDEAEWRARTFPERFSFIQTVRAFSDWLRHARKGELELAIHLIAEPVYREIACGRLDVLELLSCHDTRFWAEVHVGREIVERRLFQLDPQTPLRDVLDELDLPEDGWQFEVEPAPTLFDLVGTERDPQRRLDEAIYLIGVVPGSTLRFRAAREPERPAPPLPPG